MIVFNQTGQKISATIQTGVDLKLILDLQSDWGSYKANILAQLMSTHPNITTDYDVFCRLIKEYNLTDLHWDWAQKAWKRLGSDYQWFYLIENNKVQGVCVIYFPEKSRFDSKNIFYIDYLATAYWNRNRPSHKAVYSGVGKELINYAVNYACKNLGYRPGFCLHSLPDAETFYFHLGMKDFGIDPNKEDLRIFEASFEVASKLGDISNAA
ncbi:GNAT family N-acetyltransferase [Pantoea sp. paga]|uniref:GNAT family N-acetyltransferase n=1 Tax=Pantoea sp. paga TaxID=2597519 RepID=UPI00117FC38A|nr:GNAT family N-acetyltransferase [Pantoea sp. paga]TSH79510.1 GNAT family N-acetyltransferase [Pantoea sp. paga]